MSDLHLETPKARPSYEEFVIQPECPCLALLGDVGQTSDPRLFEFLTRQLQQFEVLLYVLGNHEPYGATFAVAKEKVRAFEADVEQQRHSTESSIQGRFVFLDQTRYDLSDDLTVLGCTLFSSIAREQEASVEQFVSDFSDIGDWTIESHNCAHQTNVQWLNSEIRQCIQKEPNRSIVVFTHHSPTLLPEANDPRHLEDNSQVRSAFATDLSHQPCWIAPQVRLWAFGHTHFNCDLVDPQTGKRVVANQKGHRKSESLTFSGNKIVEIESSQILKSEATRMELHTDRRKVRQTDCTII